MTAKSFATLEFVAVTQLWLVYGWLLLFTFESGPDTHGDK